ncbi:MAG: thiamine phosphate synthase [Fimbriimonadales bacterium]|nr:thiamine phosphate synthase [Fimbriimonadales bacterium]
MPAVPTRVLMLILNYLPGVDAERLVRIAEAGLRGGVNWLMLRIRDMPASLCLDLALVLRRLTREHRALFGVNPSPALAEWSGADALHLPESAPYHPPHEGALLGRSVHSVSAAQRATAEGCHYLLAGAIYPTRSHPDKQPAGLPLLQTVREAVALPLIAIGGITPERVAECLEAGARGVAVISGISDAPDPETAARLYAQSLGL